MDLVRLFLDHLFRRLLFKAIDRDLYRMSKKISWAFDGICLEVARFLYLLWSIELPWRHAYLFCKKNPSAMPLFDPPRLLIFVEWSLNVMNKNRFSYMSRHVYQFLEIGKPPRLYHPPRQFDTSEYFNFHLNFLLNFHINFYFLLST